MEHVTGGTLHDRLDRRLSLTEVLQFVAPLAEALDYAHSQGIIHRDIKPSNVLLDEESKPILTDFGLARMLEGSAGLTQANAVLGTPEYISPEQALGQSADQRSDLYALGIIIYQMLLGRTPFRADTSSATLMAHIHQAVPLPTELDPDLNPWLEPILLSALAKDPSDRYQTPGELIQALASVSTQPEVKPEFGTQTLIEKPVVPDSETDDRREEDKKDKFDSAGEVAGGYIAQDQAQVMAIRHARENTDFYGPVHAGRELVWEVASSEEGEDYYQVRLSYRPARRFRGTPGTELFTIDKAGSIELRQLLNEPIERKGVAFPVIVAGMIVVISVVVGGLFASGAFPPQSEPTPSPPPQTAPGAIPEPVAASGAIPTSTAAPIPPTPAAIAVDTASPSSSATPTRTVALPTPTPINVAPWE